MLLKTRLLKIVIALTCSLAMTQVEGSGNTPLKIYTEQHPPHNFLGPDGMEGYVVDVVQALKARLGRDDKINLAPWLRAFRYLDENRPVMVLSLARTPGREDKYQWVGPIVDMNLVLVVANDKHPRLSSLADARKLRSIAVLELSSADALLKDHEFNNVVAAKRAEINFRMLLKGRVEAWLNVESSVLYHIHRLGIDPDKFRLVDVGHNQELYLVFSLATDRAEVARWQQALEQFKADGGLAKIQAKHQRYFGQQAE